MKLTDWFLAELEAEAPRTRRALERVPQGKDDWKPHDKSMPLGRLAMLVAQMPSWISLIVNRDDLRRVPGGNQQRMRRMRNVDVACKHLHVRPLDSMPEVIQE